MVKGKLKILKVSNVNQLFSPIAIAKSKNAHSKTNLILKNLSNFENLVKRSYDAKKNSGENYSLVIGVPGQGFYYYTSAKRMLIKVRCDPLKKV